MTQLQRLTRLAVRFRDQRDWKQFHTSKELAISLVVEATELLEIMQWRHGEDLDATVLAKRNEIADEIGDCVHSLLLLGDCLGIDLAEAFERKLRKTARRYPVRRAKGSPAKHTDLAPPRRKR